MLSVFGVELNLLHFSVDGIAELRYSSFAMDKTKASLLLDKAVWKEFQIYCIRHDLKVSETAEKALRKFMTEEKKLK